MVSARSYAGIILSPAVVSEFKLSTVCTGVYGVNAPVITSAGN